MLTKIVSTGGQAVSDLEDGGYGVPKRELISKMDAAINSGRLTVWSALKESKQLHKQLISFNVKLNKKGTETFEGRSGTHDDLVVTRCLTMLDCILPGCQSPFWDILYS